MKSLCEKIKKNHPQSEFYYVGGYVRDLFMGLEPKDIDIEMFSITPEQFESTLKELNIPFQAMGVSFGIYKVKYNGVEIDFSFPRTEVKTGLGHTEFAVQIDPFLTPYNASLRRDFTINTIMKNVLTDEIFDFHNGIKDIENKLIKHTSDAFCEDPLRVLRAFQFAARFGFSVDDHTVNYCKLLLVEKPTIAKERIWVEWEKFLLKSKIPSCGLWFLFHCNWIETELYDLVGVQQDPIHHPEGDAFIHTAFVTDAACEIADQNNLTDDEKIILVLSAICHDLGKAPTTKWNEKKGKWTAYGHEKESVPLTESFLKKINCPAKYHKAILCLVSEHMVHLTSHPSPSMVRKLINKLALNNTSLKMLRLMVLSDYSGRPPLIGKLSEKFEEILRIADELGLDGETAIPPLVTGDDLIALGFTQGKDLGDTLKNLYNMQIAGNFTSKEEGLKRIKHAKFPNIQKSKN